MYDIMSEVRGTLMVILVFVLSYILKTVVHNIRVRAKKLAKLEQKRKQRAAQVRADALYYAKLEEARRVYNIMHIND